MPSTSHAALIAALRAGSSIAGWHIGGEALAQSIRSIADTPHSCRSITLAGCHVTGNCDLRWISFRGEIVVLGAVLERLDVDCATLGNLTVSHSTISVLSAARARLTNGLFIRGSALGYLSVRDSRISGPLDLSGTSVGHSPRRRALEGASVLIEGSLLMRRGFCAFGEVRLYRADVRGSVDCSAGSFGGTRAVRGCLDFTQVDVGGSIYLRDGFTCAGGIDLEGARIANSLEIHAVRITAERLSTGRALDLRQATVARQLRLQDCSVAGLVDLGGCSCRSLCDDLSFRTWDPGAALNLDGFTYELISADSPRTLEDRTAWLALQPVDAGLAAHDQLAASYRRSDERPLEREIRYRAERERHKRERVGYVAKLWSGLLRLTVGYGYKPIRALALLLTLIVATSVYYYVAATHEVFELSRAGTPVHIAARRPVPTSPNPVAYSLDAAVPLLNLEEDGRFEIVASELGTVTSYVRWAECIIGWTLIAMLAVALPKVIER